MQPSSGQQPPPPLSAAVSAELARLEAEVRQAADPLARSRLAGLGDAAASRVLRKIWKNRRGVQRLSAYIMRMVEKEVAEHNAPGIPNAESSVPFRRATQQEDSTPRPQHYHDVQMEDQSPDAQIAFGLSNQARIEPMSPARQTPCRSQNEIVSDLDGNGMVVESPVGWNSPGGFQNQTSSSLVANRGRTEACLDCQMVDSPVRNSTPSSVQDITRGFEQMVAGPSASVGLATRPSVAAGNFLSTTASPQMLALGEIEFDRRFLIHVYLAEKKLEEVIEDVNYIMYLKSLPMDSFEPEIWNRFGSKYVPASDRRKNLDWDPSKPRKYLCNVEQRNGALVNIFKGPYFDNTRTHLQKIIGDDNVLIVKFADIPGLKNSANNFGTYGMFYRPVAEDGILLGLRRYRFFIYKDGGKEDKQKEEKKKAKNKTFIPSVRCYFVRTESGWDRDVPYILFGYTIVEARRRFMHIHTAETVSKYLDRFALILSKTITLDVNFSEVNVTTIEDEPCRDEHGNSLTDDDGKPLIHTDGTGFISFDLAVKCPTSVFKGNFLKAHEVQDTVDSENQRYLISYPLLIQFRMFHNGKAVKGTLLADKRLPNKTIHIRPSMIKIKDDSDSLSGQPFNSFEVVTTSNRPKKASTSKFLIALLHYGNVPAEYFLELMGKALEDVNEARHKARDSLEVALNHADMDDLMSARMILSGIQPKDEAFLQYQLALMSKQERKCIQEAKIPIDDCYYLMGTTDPTGTLKPDQICVIHDNRQVSGKVLVYKHPGLHFGDIHKLTATHIDGLEDIVGNSKYAIFFPTSGSRSLADEIANSDFDGDMYWVSWNPQLLESFEPGKPWERRIQPKKTKQENPQHYDGPKLESLLFSEFLKARFLPSYVTGIAANCWLALMDRLLTPGVSQSEKDSIRIKMLELVDIYYWALDARKTGNKVIIPPHLMVKKYPHFLEREPSYHSTSVLGNIYDQAKLQQESETVPPIKVSPLKCFTEETVTEVYKRRWTDLYHDYLRKSSSLCKLADKEARNLRFWELYQDYKRILYDAEDFEASPRSHLELLNEACAIYQVVYERAMLGNEVSKCGFAWKVAGRALCELYLLKRGGERVTCQRSVLEDAFKKYRA